MATSATTVSVSGTTFTYTITDMLGSTITVAAVPGGISSISNSGTILVDGQAALVSLMLQLSSGQRPVPSTLAPTYVGH